MRTLKLLTLTLALALLAPFAVLAQAVSGIVTVGTGSSTVGTVNLSDYQTVSGAVVAALNRSKTVFFLPGTYELDTPITVSASDVTILGTSASTLLVGGTSGAGLFSVTGSRFKMRDVAVKFDTMVNDQVAVDILGDDPSFDGVTFTNDATTGSTSNPMIYVRAGRTSGGIAAPAFRGCRFHGAKGMTMVQVSGDSTDSDKLGQGALFVGNHFGVETGTPEKCGVGVHFQSAGEFVFTANRAHGLGDGTDGITAFLLLTTTGAEGEAQHAVISGNNFELLTGDHVIRGDGFRFGIITGNLFGRFGGNGSNEGCIHLTDNLASGTDGGDWSITANDFHNASTSTGRTIYIEDTDSFLISNNTFALCNGRQIRPLTTATNGRIVGNIFRMAGGVTGSLIETSGAYTGLEISDNWIPSDCTQLTAVPTSGCVLEGMALGGSAHNRMSPGVRVTRATGAANAATVTVAGIATTDTLMRVYSETDKVLETLSNYTVGAGVITQTTGSTSGETLVIEWYDA